MKFIVWFSHDHEILEVSRQQCQLGLLGTLTEEEWEEEVGPLIQCDYEGERFDARILQMVPSDNTDTTETIAVLRKAVAEKKLTTHHKLLKLCSRVRPQRRERRLPMGFISTEQSDSDRPEEPPRKKMALSVTPVKVPDLPPLSSMSVPLSAHHHSSSQASSLTLCEPTPGTSNAGLTPTAKNIHGQRQKLFTDSSWVAAQRYVRRCGFEWGSVEGKFHKI